MSCLECIFDVVVNDFVRLLGCYFPFNALPVPMLRQVSKLGVFPRVFDGFRYLELAGVVFGCTGSLFGCAGITFGCIGIVFGCTGSYLAA